MSIGAALADARQRAGLSITQVSHRTRIRETIIRAIERDDYSLCGGDFYARGHIRNIAKAVGADPEPLVLAYDETHGGPPGAIHPGEALERTVPIKLRERRRPNYTVAIAIALAVVAVYGTVRFLGGSAGEPARPGSEVAVPSVSAAPSPRLSARTGGARPGAAGGRVTVRLEASTPNTVSVIGNGRRIFRGRMAAGEVRTWTAGRRIKLYVSDAGGVRLRVNGTDMGVPGARGREGRFTFGPG